VRHHRLGLFGVLVGVVLLAASCNWPLVGFGPDRTGYSASETAISPANVGQLSQQWTADLIGPGSDPVVADGHVFVTGQNMVPIGSPGSFLYSFDAAGSTNCSGSAQKTCTPQWSNSFPSQNCGGTNDVPTGLSDPAVDNGEVWIGESTAILCNESSGQTVAYDENTGAARVTSEGAVISGSPTVSGGSLYGSWFASASFGSVFESSSGIGAVDTATGATQFTAGTTSTLTGAVTFTPPAVSNGILYAAAANTLYAFDATGTTDCGPPPPPLPDPALGFSTFCNPLWTATLPGTVSTTTAPAVANGFVYVGDSSGTLSAIPAGGCGAATCLPAWTASTKGAIETSPAVTATTVYVGSDDGGFYAFPAKGCGAATCQPLWRAKTGGTVKSSPSVAGDVVYVGSDDDDLYAFNASGCGAATCQPLLRTDVGAPVETSPAIANGQVFVTDTAGTLHAYGLPAAGS
jgi:hypothetical protein